MQEVPN